MHSQTNNSSDHFQLMMELQRRQEILERWLASEVLTDGLEQSLRGMLIEVRERLRIVRTVDGEKTF